MIMGDWLSAADNVTTTHGMAPLQEAELKLRALQRYLNTYLSRHASRGVTRSRNASRNSLWAPTQVCTCPVCAACCFATS